MNLAAMCPSRKYRDLAGGSDFVSFRDRTGFAVEWEEARDGGRPNSADQSKEKFTMMKSSYLIV